MARTIAGAVTKAVLNSLILKRQERIEHKREKEKQAALSNLSGRPPPGEDGERQVADPGSRLRELADQESCGTCRQALLELLRKPPERRREGLEIYEDEYIETKEAYMEGQADEEDLKDATTALLESADML